MEVDKENTEVFATTLLLSSDAAPPRVALRERNATSPAGIVAENKVSGAIHLERKLPALPPPR